MDIKGRVPRGTEQEIRIQTGTVWRIDVCDIRWFKEQTTTENGKREKTMGPTRKGIRMNMEELKHVYDLLGRILNEEESKREVSKEDFETTQRKTRSFAESDEEVFRDWDNHS